MYVGFVLLYGVWFVKLCIVEYRGVFFEAPVLEPWAVRDYVLNDTPERYLQATLANYSYKCHLPILWIHAYWCNEMYCSY